MDLTVHVPHINFHDPATWLYIYLVTCYLIGAIIIRLSNYSEKKLGEFKPEEGKERFGFFLLSPVILPCIISIALFLVLVFIIANVIVVGLNILSYVTIGEIAFSWFKFGE